MPSPALRNLGPLALLMLILSLFLSLLVAHVALAAGTPKLPSVTFGLGPASATKSDARPFFNYLVSPLARLTDHVAIINLSAQPLTLSVYATDASNGLDGSFTYPVKSAALVDAGKWIKVQTPRGNPTITVPARGTLILPITVAVPQNASPGDHAAAVIVSLTALSKNGTGQRINLDQRVAARVFFRVSGSERPRLAVEGLQVSYVSTGLLSGTATVRYRIHNTGNVKLEANQRVRVGGLLRTTTRVGDQAPVLLPGSEFQVTSVVKQVLPQVRMTATVVVTPLGIRGDALAQSGDAVTALHFWAVPWLLLMIIVGMLVFLVASAWLRRRSKRSRAARYAAARQPGIMSGATPSSEAAGKVQRVAVFLTVALTALALPGSVSAGGTVPYDDPAVTGSIALCDVNGNNVLSGKLTDTPFVWKAVGTSAAPSPYDQPGRTAFLAAYQPRKNVAPGDWSGYGLAPASRYTNPAHPMSQATPNSSPLTDFTTRYVPQWDGLVQLRMLLGGSNRVPLPRSYDATDIRVTGDTWQVVRGGTGPCGKQAGSATNVAVLLKLPGSAGTPKPGAIASPPPLRQSPDPQKVGSTLSGSASPAGSGAAASRTAIPGSTARQASRAADGGSLTPVFVVGGLGLALGVVLTLLASRRRQVTS